MDATKTKNRTRTRSNNRGALLMTHDGKLHDVPYYGGDGLRELYRLLNCHLVEAVRLRGPLAGLSIWCDEEGKLKPHGVNYPASLLYRYLCGGDYMAGRCVVLADNPETGDAEPLNQEQLGIVRGVLNYMHMVASMRGERIEATGPRCEIIEF